MVSALSLKKSDFFIDAGSGSNVYIIASPKKEEGAKQFIHDMGLEKRTRGLKARMAKNMNLDKLVKNGILKKEYHDDAKKRGDFKAVGCALSHLSVLQDFVSSPKSGEFVTIFEDDNVYPRGKSQAKKEFHSVFNTIKKKLPKDKPYVVYLGYCYSSGNEGTYNNLSAISKIKTPRCTHALTINRKAVKLILEKALPIYQPIDEQLIQIKEIEILGTDMPIFNQDWDKDVFPAYKVECSSAHLNDTYKKNLKVKEFLETTTDLTPLRITILIAGILFFLHSCYIWYTLETKNRIGKFVYDPRRKFKMRFLVVLYFLLSIGIAISAFIKDIRTKKPSPKNENEKGYEKIPQHHIDFIYRALKDGTESMDQVGLDYRISCGTLLGAVRHKGLIPWDHDADIFVKKDEFETKKSKLKESLNKKGYKFDFFSNKQSVDDGYLEIYRIQKPKDWFFVDVFITKEMKPSSESGLDQKKKWFTMNKKPKLLGWVTEDEWSKGPTLFEFGSLKLKGFKDPEPILKRWYGEKCLEECVKGEDKFSASSVKAALPSPNCLN